MYCRKMAVKWTTYSAGVHDYYRATIREAAFYKLGILTKVILEGKGSYMKEKKAVFYTTVLPTHKTNPCGVLI